jgi:hypothetical protein
VHYSGIELTPGGGDYSPVKFGNLHSFVITDKATRTGGSECCTVWEVGRVEMQYGYRSIYNPKPGQWAFPEEWNRK